MFLASVAALLSVALFAAACGGDDTSDTTADDQAAATDQPSDTDGDTDGNTATNADTDDGADESESAAVITEAPAPITAEPFENNDDLSQRPTINPDLLGDLDGFVISDIVVGEGEEATAGRFISMQYVGVLQSDGTPFDASWDRGQSFDFQLGNGQVISGWDLGIEGMRVGGRRILQIPSGLAYGATARGDVIGANADLLFVVDLTDIEPLPEPAPPIPEDALGAVDALETIDLVVGTGPTPERGDLVAMEYVGVTAIEGVESDSTWANGGVPFRFVFEQSRVIGGWTEGLAGMQPGGERIVRIPADQAFGQDDMVYRIHLTEVIAAPALHKLSFTGPPPDDVEVTTLVEGSGPGAEGGQSIEANLVIYYHNNTDLMSSTYLAEQTSSLVLEPADDQQNLNNALLGVKVGETRQVILPAAIAYPDGIPPSDPLTEDDAVVIVLEVLEIS